MTTKFTDLTEIAAVDVDDADVLALSDVSASASRKVTVASLRTAVATELSQVQVEDDTSTDFGTVSGERLGQAVAANLNATGTAPLYACRAWARVTPGNPPAIVASGNFTSMTRIATGLYEMVMTTAMPNANYAIICCGSDNNDNNAVSVLVVDETFTPTTTTFRVRALNSGVGASDTISQLSSITVFA